MSQRELDNLIERRKLGFTEQIAKPTAKPLDKYKSKLEREFATTGWLYFEQAIGKKILSVRYEPIRLMLPGMSYRIDWALETIDGYLFAETKSKHTKNYRDARSKLRAAAAVFSKWRFFEVRKEQGQWVIEEIRS